MTSSDLDCSLCAKESKRKPTVVQHYQRRYPKSRWLNGQESNLDSQPTLAKSSSPSPSSLPSNRFHKRSSALRGAQPPMDSFHAKQSETLEQYARRKQASKYQTDNVAEQLADALDQIKQRALKARRAARAKPGLIADQRETPDVPQTLLDRLAKIEAFQQRLSQRYPLDKSISLSSNTDTQKQPISTSSSSSSTLVSHTDSLIQRAVNDLKRVFQDEQHTLTPPRSTPSLPLPPPAPFFSQQPSTAMVHAPVHISTGPFPEPAHLHDTSMTSLMLDLHDSFAQGYSLSDDESDVFHRRFKFNLHPDMYTKEMIDHKVHQSPVMQQRRHSATARATRLVAGDAFPHDPVAPSSPTRTLSSSLLSSFVPSESIIVPVHIQQTRSPSTTPSRPLSYPRTPPSGQPLLVDLDRSFEHLSVLSPRLESKYYQPDEDEGEEEENDENLLTPIRMPRWSAVDHDRHSTTVSPQASSVASSSPLSLYDRDSSPPSPLTSPPASRISSVTPEKLYNDRNTVSSFSSGLPQNEEVSSSSSSFFASRTLSSTGFTLPPTVPRRDWNDLFEEDLEVSETSLTTVASLSETSHAISAISSQEVSQDAHMITTESSIQRFLEEMRVSTDDDERLSSHSGTSLDWENSQEEQENQREKEEEQQQQIESHSDSLQRDASLEEEDSSDHEFTHLVMNSPSLGHSALYASVSVSDYDRLVNDAVSPVSVAMDTAMPFDSQRDSSTEESILLSTSTETHHDTNRVHPAKMHDEEDDDVGKEDPFFFTSSSSSAMTPLATASLSSSSSSSSSFVSLANLLARDAVSITEFVESARGRSQSPFPDASISFSREEIRSCTPIERVYSPYNSVTEFFTNTLTTKQATVVEDIQGDHHESCRRLSVALMERWRHGESSLSTDMRLQMMESLLLLLLCKSEGDHVNTMYTEAPHMDKGVFESFMMILNEQALPMHYMTHIHLLYDMMQEMIHQLYQRPNPLKSIPRAYTGEHIRRHVRKKLEQWMSSSQEDESVLDAMLIDDVNDEDQRWMVDVEHVREAVVLCMEDKFVDELLDQSLRLLEQNETAIRHLLVPTV